MIWCNYNDIAQTNFLVNEISESDNLQEYCTRNMYVFHFTTFWYKDWIKLTSVSSLWIQVEFLNYIEFMGFGEPQIWNVQQNTNFLLIGLYANCCKTTKSKSHENTNFLKTQNQEEDTDS